MEIINFKKKKMKLLTKEQQEPYENEKICYICKEKFENKYVKDKTYRKVIVIIQGNIKNVKLAELNTNIATVFLNTKTLKMI